MSKLSRALWRRGGKRKGSLQLHLWNLNICMKKLTRNADWQDDISKDVIILGKCVSIFVYICSRLHFALIGRNLTAHVYRELQGNWNWNSNSREIQVVCKISFLFPSRRESARESLLAGWWYSDLDCATTGS